MIRAILLAAIVSAATFGLAEPKPGDRCSTPPTESLVQKPPKHSHESDTARPISETTRSTEAILGSMTTEATARQAAANPTSAHPKNGDLKKDLDETADCADCCLTAELCQACCLAASCLKTGADCAACRKPGVCCEAKGKVGSIATITAASASACKSAAFTFWSRSDCPACGRSAERCAKCLIATPSHAPATDSESPLRSDRRAYGPVEGK